MFDLQVQKKTDLAGGNQPSQHIEEQQFVSPSESLCIFFLLPTSFEINEPLWLKLKTSLMNFHRPFSLKLLRNCGKFESQNCLT